MVETLIIRAKIEPKYKSHVCCPCCFHLYDPAKRDLASCDFKEDPGGDACGKRLRKKDGKPVREFIAHDFKDWLARLYARPGVEELLDHDVLRPLTPGKMADIWDAPVLREFTGLDGRNFMQDKGTNCRLIFSINMDGFNPYGNKQLGKQRYLHDMPQSSPRYSEPHGKRIPFWHYTRSQGTVPYADQSPSGTTC